MTSVFFDMDGVLADFVRGALKLHKREDVPISSVPWGLEDRLGIPIADFWKGMDYDFWANLPLLEDGTNLLYRVERMIQPDRIGFLTSPCQTAGCRDGKADWVNQWFKPYKSRLFMGSQKDLFADGSKILIDDRDENCHAWARAGGQPVLVPRPWNGLSYKCDANGNFDVESVLSNVEASLRVANVEY